MRLLRIGLAALVLGAAAIPARAGEIADQFNAFIAGVETTYKVSVHTGKITETDGTVSIETLQINGFDYAFSLVINGVKLDGAALTDDQVTFQALGVRQVLLTFDEMARAYNNDAIEAVEYELDNLTAGPGSLFRIPATFFTWKGTPMEELAEKSTATRVRAIYDRMIAYLPGTGLRLAKGQFDRARLTWQIDGLALETTIRQGSFAKMDETGLFDVTAKLWVTKGPSLPRQMTLNDVAIPKLFLRH